METITQSKKLKLIITHLLLAYLLSINTFISLSTLWGLSVVLIGTVFILTSPDPKGQYPLIFSAYIVGVEVLLRMTSAKLFWEFGKYSIIYFLLLGILRQRSKIFIYTPILFLIFIPSYFNCINTWAESCLKTSFWVFKDNRFTTFSLCFW
mgnify:CR=1 FL=1